MAADLLF